MEPAARILIVEDEVIVAKDMELMLRNLGYAVCGIVRTGEEGVRRASQELPDLVMMDIGLKGEIDGIETARQIKAAHDIPVVYFTAITDQSTFERAKQTDPYGFICKPFEEKDLRSVVELAVHHGRLHKQLRATLRLMGGVLDCLEEALMVADLEVRVVCLNAAAEALTGWSKDQAAGAPLAAVLVCAPGQPLPALETLRGQTLCESVPSSFTLLTRDQRQVPVQGTICSVVDSAKCGLGYAVRLRPVAEGDDLARFHARAEVCQ
jgi:CheY-like chemotaxis protein